MPSRYLKLGAAKNTDRDTSLFQPDHPPRNPSSSWPSLRRSRSHSSREAAALESPRASVTYHPEQARIDEEEQQERTETEEEATSKKDRERGHGVDLEQRPELRRAKSSTVHRQDEGIQHRHGREGVDRNGGGGGGGFFHLPRAQSMRYNRIVSAAEESVDGERGAIDPPRHSCVERFCLERRMDAKNKPALVRVSGSYQTRDGEVVSIECAQCGRRLGTVAQRVDLDEGSIRLCRVCHPAGEDRSSAGKAAGESRRRSGGGGGGFLRGLRRILGGLTTSSSSSKRDRR